MMLMTLPYNPQVQVSIIMALELLYIIGAWTKYSAVQHFLKKSTLLYIVIQGVLMIVFLALVFGMTLKGYTYGNESTKGALDRDQWGYGENIAIVVISIALSVEFVLFLFSITILAKNLVYTLVSMCKELQAEDPTQSKFIKSMVKEIGKKKPEWMLERVKDGIFFRLVLKN